MALFEKIPSRHADLQATSFLGTWRVAMSSHRVAYPDLLQLFRGNTAGGIFSGTIHREYAESVAIQDKDLNETSCALLIRNTAGESYHPLDLVLLDLRAMVHETISRSLYSSDSS